MLLAETGASEVGDGGARKAAWIRDLLQVQLAGRFPQIHGFVWFDRSEPGFDTMPIASSPAAQQAFAESIRSPLYVSNTLGGLSASPIPAP
jgi:hypothetical protein